MKNNFNHMKKLCPKCAGTGTQGYLMCSYCAGTGEVFI